MKSLLLRKITRERIKRDILKRKENCCSKQQHKIGNAYLSATGKKLKHTIKVSYKKQPPITEQKWRTLDSVFVIAISLSFSAEVDLNYFRKNKIFPEMFTHVEVVVINIIKYQLHVRGATGVCY